MVLDGGMMVAVIGVLVTIRVEKLCSPDESEKISVLSSTSIFYRPAK